VEDLGVEGRRMLKIGWQVVDWIHLAQDADQSVATSCEYGNYLSASIKHWEFID
jgi:hypothetical protein